MDKQYAEYLFQDRKVPKKETTSISWLVNQNFHWLLYLHQDIGKLLFHLVKEKHHHQKKYQTSLTKLQTVKRFICLERITKMDGGACGSNLTGCHLMQPKHLF